VTARATPCLLLEPLAAAGTHEVPKMEEGAGGEGAGGEGAGGEGEP